MIGCSGFAAPVLADPLAVPLHGGAPAGRPSHAVVLVVAVVAFGLLAWIGSAALDAALGRWG